MKNGFLLGDWWVDPQAGTIDRDGQARRLEPKVIDVLLLLAEHPDRVVSRQSIVERVWGARAVSDEPLTRCIASLRRKLGDDRSDPTYIQTIPKRGYRLVAPVVGARASMDHQPTANGQHPIIDDFELMRELGSGAMASVWLAREPELKRLVAIKILRPELASDGTACARFEREAQAAARLVHVNVGQIYRLGRTPDGSPYIAMEYVKGRTLRSVIDSQSPMPEQEAVGLLHQISNALEAAHRHGVIHRDIAPENIVVESESNRAVLLDFGLAALRESGSREVERLTAQGVKLGRPDYMSPEQIVGDPATEESDIYGVGLIGFELMTGDGPYVLQSGDSIEQAHLASPPIHLQNARPDATAELAELLARCLRKEAARRPSAAVLLTQLNDLLHR